MKFPILYFLTHCDTLFSMMFDISKNNKYIRSSATIERKRAEARAERELAARKRDDARKAKNEVKILLLCVE